MAQRPIKFRQWNPDLKRFQYDIGAGDNSWIGAQYVTWEKYPLTQFTGLLDKNGTEIWEGDIAINDRREKGKVVFSNGAFWLQYLPPYNWDPMEPAQIINEKIEVIGNTFKGEKGGKE